MATKAVPVKTWIIILQNKISSNALFSIPIIARVTSLMVSIVTNVPIGNISFLDCIPPIGTKLATGLTTNTRVYGPGSELNHLSGDKKRTLYFYFGMPKTTDSKEQYSRPAVDNVF